MRFQIEDNQDANLSAELETDSEFVSDSAIDWRIFDPPEPSRDQTSSYIEWKFKSVEIPLSLRIIKKKKLLQEGIRATGDSVRCSVNKAFSNMVFIIRELHCFTIHMREMILYEDLQSILSRVQTEMHISFVWLFQQVFSHTPTLMVYVMILLANYSVYSMSVIAAPPPPPAVIETVSIVEYRNTNKFGKFDIGKTTSIRGGSGGGGNLRPVSSSTDGGGRFRTEQPIVPDGVREREESVSGREMREEEVKLWESFVYEAMKMRLEVLDHEITKRFVSPVSAKIENDDSADYIGTELFYQMGLAQDPMNPLLLANYAQFLYLVARDYDRAEEYFKRAVKVDSPDAEALNKYASFLWHAKKDLWAAEETYVEAMSADPTNSYYAANYAHFLWNTGGEDTCYPLDAPEDV